MPAAGSVGVDDKRRLRLHRKSRMDGIGYPRHRRLADAAHIQRPLADTLGLDNIESIFKPAYSLHTSLTLILGGDVEHDKHQQHKYLELMTIEKVAAYHTSAYYRTQRARRRLHYRLPGATLSAGTIILA